MNLCNLHNPNFHARQASNRVFDNEELKAIMMGRDDSSDEEEENSPPTNPSDHPDVHAAVKQAIDDGVTILGGQMATNSAENDVQRQKTKDCITNNNNKYQHRSKNHAPTRSRPTMAAEIRKSAPTTPPLTMPPMAEHCAYDLVSPSPTTGATF